MNILGISCYYHDAAAALVQEGRLIAAAEEERFNRNKHSSSFPTQAADFCLQEANLTVRDVDYVGFYEKPFLKFARFVQDHVRSYPFSRKNFARQAPHWLDKRLTIPQLLKKEIGYEGETLFIKHHLSHAASAFLSSPFEEAAIITCDGVGEQATTTYGKGESNQIDIRKKIDYPHSLGLLYSAITTYLGFRANYDEGKVMGLASYGQPRYLDEFEELITIKEDGSYQLDTDYFGFSQGNKMYSQKLVGLLGPARAYEDKIKRRHEDIAASLQKITEKALIKIGNHVQQQTGEQKLCLGGGVFLNCVANRKLLEETDFADVFIQPAAADSGGSLGAALYIYNTLLDKPRQVDLKKDGVFLGPNYSDEEIAKALNRQGVDFKRLNRDQLLEFTAEKLAADKIVGWFQGKMEFGPRALGHRSILANPENAEMRDKLNKKIKHREEFRPFAPSLLTEEKENYGLGSSPFMILSFEVKERKRDDIKSATHIDGTARPQTVSRTRNKLYYDLISKFQDKTSIPALLNTSFNDSGEPIVRSPTEAYRCFKKTGMDYLVIGNCVVSKDQIAN